MSVGETAFARMYDRYWGSVPRELAPRLRSFYELQPIAKHNRSVLDVGCGTGRLALHFAENGYHVTGVDTSEAMLSVARDNLLHYVRAEQVSLLLCDAREVNLEVGNGLAVSTFAVMNQMADIANLQSAVEHTRQNLIEGGLLIFDLNTRAGLRSWNNISVHESPDALIVSRGVFDEQAGKASMCISGCLSTGDGCQRFEETIIQTAFPMTEVGEVVRQVGFTTVYFAGAMDFSASIDAPEELPRVFVVAFV